VYVCVCVRERVRASVCVFGRNRGPDRSMNKPRAPVRAPTPYTLHAAPYTLHAAPYTMHPTSYTLHPKIYTPDPTPYALLMVTARGGGRDVEGRTQHNTLNTQHQTLNTQHSTLNPKYQIPNTKYSTLNTKY